MPLVEFHTGVAEPVAFAYRLLRKAYRMGSRVLVTAPQPRLDELDHALWTTDERDFLAHARMPGAVPAVASRSPIWLALQAGLLMQEGGPKVLVNLGADMADGDALGLCERVIEIVALDVDEAQAGRQRWREYKALGWEIKHHGNAERAVDSGS